MQADTAVAGTELLTKLGDESLLCGFLFTSCKMQCAGLHMRDL